MLAAPAFSLEPDGCEVSLVDPSASRRGGGGARPAAVAIELPSNVRYSRNLVVRGRVSAEKTTGYLGIKFIGANGKEGSLSVPLTGDATRFVEPLWKLLPARGAIDALWNEGDPILKATIYLRGEGGALPPFLLEELRLANDPEASDAAEIRRPVAITPELAETHPRLLMNRSGLENFRQKIKDPAVAPLWQRFLAFAEPKLGERPPNEPRQAEDPFRGYGSRLPVTALAYLGTGDKRYLDSTREWLDALCGYGEWAGNTDLAAGHICFGMAVAYDWLYDELTPEERTKIEDALFRHGRILYVWSEANQGRWWSSAWWQNHSWINHTGMAAAGGALLSRHPQEALRWIERARGCFQYTYDYFAHDGSNYEGVGYARYGTEWMVLYAELMKGLTGEDLYQMPYLKNVARFLLYTLLPDGVSVVNFADAPTGNRDPRSFVWRLASEYKDGYAQWLGNRLLAAPEGTVTSAFEVLWYDPSVKPLAPDSLPTAAFFSDLGLAVFRDNWKDSGSVVSVKCGPPAGFLALNGVNTLSVAAATLGHAHPDANSFSWWAQGGWRIGDPAGFTRYKVTHNENVWMVGHYGQRGEAEWLDASSYLGDVPQPRVVRLASSPQADYFLGEAAPAYAWDANLKAFRRHLVFIKGESPYLVCLDQLESADPHVWSSLLHAESPFTVSPRNVFQTLGKYPVWGAVVAPGDVTLTPGVLKVAGQKSKDLEQKGYELLVRPDGRARQIWQVTILALDEKPVRVTRRGPWPELAVGEDTISFDEDGSVSVNARPLPVQPAEKFSPSE